LSLTLSVSSSKYTKILIVFAQNRPINKPLKWFKSKEGASTTPVLVQHRGSPTKIRFCD